MNNWKTVEPGQAADEAEGRFPASAVNAGEPAAGEAILLVGDDFVIMDMNLAAISMFGDQRGRLCYQSLDCGEAACGADCPIMHASGEQRQARVLRTRTGSGYFAWSSLLLHGKNNRKLFMVIMRQLGGGQRYAEQGLAMTQIDGDMAEYWCAHHGTIPPAWVLWGGLENRRRVASAAAPQP